MEISNEQGNGGSVTMESGMKRKPGAGWGREKEGGGGGGGGMRRESRTREA